MRTMSKKQILKMAIFLLATLLASCHFFNKTTLFHLLPPEKTGVHFENKVTENERTNVLEYMNIYTGAGVAAGDVNNDGLTDLFFAGNQVSCRLYFNRSTSPLLAEPAPPKRGEGAGGEVKFEDVTEQSGIRTDRWCTGVTMADVNADGWLDIYVCVSGNGAWASTANLLFINKKDGTFKEEAAHFGIADQRLCMHASFFDYDVDGDLDLFLITNPADLMVTGVNNVTAPQPTGERKGADILYRNEGNGKFTDVSKLAGIVEDGYSLGATVSDFNLDGFPDIYVSNDFLSSDIFYVNQGDGTFKNQLAESFKHTSFASMGNDAADVNNDGLPDIFVLDMLPEDNFRRKMLIPATNIDKFNLAIEKGFARQYTRNTLQLNLGIRNTEYEIRNAGDGGDSAFRIPHSAFQEVALLSGVAATDWSWSPLFADFDLDGDKDLLVTNGFYRDLGDLDYINYQFAQRSPMGTQEAKRAKKLDDIHGLPTVPLQNYLFENLGTTPVPTFQKRSDDWGLSEKTFTNGACYADLDNDGDLEIILNEFNEKAKIYENKARQMGEAAPNFLSIKLVGKAANPFAVGARIWLHTPDGTVQFLENQPARGYESSMDTRPFFGLGQNAVADSVGVVWSGGWRQVLKNVAANQFLVVEDLRIRGFEDLTHQQVSTSNPQIFKSSNPQNFTHLENNFLDFKQQILLPHGHSKQSPALATGDLNGDGLADFFASGAMGGKSALFFQKPDGSFSKKTLEPACPADETDALFFDADGDDDLDLYVVRGGSEHRAGDAALQNALFQNDGRGNFSLKPDALPDTKSSGGCVAAGDFDGDGDLDLFVGGRISSGEYPRAPRSFLLKNDGKGKFSDATPDFLKNIGMVADAIFADFDGDGWQDLALTGEFMPVQIFKNERGKIHHSSFIIHHSEGWWNSLAAADFDGDGDLDLLAGNLGLNTRYRASPEQPLSIFSKDFDGNGTTDPIIVHYDGGERQVFHTRDDLAVQIPAMKKRFSSYQIFAKTSFDKSFRSEELAGALELRAECFESSYFENLGGGKFTRRALPLPAQVSPIQDFLIEDFNNDGKLDFLAVGNSYETEYTTGRYDAGMGCLFLGDGRGGFSFVENRKSGFWADGDARSIIRIEMKNGQKRIVVGNNGAGLLEYFWK